MKATFLLFLLLPVAAQVYVTLRVWQLLAALPVLRMAAAVLMSAAFVSSIVALTGIIDRWPMWLATAVYEVGTSWLIVLLYLALAMGVLDLLRLCHATGCETLHANAWLAAGIAVGIAALLAYGYWHYNDKQRVPLQVTTHKMTGPATRIVLVSDLHLGYHNRRPDLHRWLQLLKAVHPAAIVVGGDIIDGSYRPVEEQGMAREFRELGIPVYACLGNHDYYTGLSADLKFCREAGITVLRDDTASLAGITLIGRDDRTNPRRKPLEHIMRGIDRSKFLLEIDHQPYHLEEAERCGVDFEFAGHTHYGQVWPVNWITRAVFEDAFGPYRKGKTQYYVSSGLGIWGGKFRIGTRSEYIVLTINPA